MKENKRLHFGVIIPNIDEQCQFTILQGVNEYAVKEDIDLTIYVGTCHLAERRFASHCETCFELIRENSSLDGFILFAGFMGHIYDYNELKEILDEFSGKLPTVAISFPSPGIPTVLTDNTLGMYDAVNHMICEHGKKQIAFITGPDESPEAGERTLGYKNALAKNGIEFDENYLLPGDFTKYCAAEAIAELIDRRKLPFDAIVTSSDEAAMGVIKELGKRGILVPRDVAVMGFDDKQESASHMPSISTVRQEFIEIGKVGTEMLCRKISGEQIEEIREVTSTFVARQSCGCLGREVSDIAHSFTETPPDESGFHAFVMHEFMSIFSGHAKAEQIEKWVDALVFHIMEKPFNKDSFYHLIDEILINYSYNSGGLLKWFQALDVLTRGVQQYSREVGCTQSTLTALVFAATLINNVRIKENIMKEYGLAQMRLTLRRTTSTLAQTIDVASIADELHKLLPSLFLDTAIIGLYKSEKKTGEYVEAGTVEKVVGFSGKEQIDLKYSDDAPIRFSDYSTLKGFDFDSERQSVFIFPLFFEDEELGLLLLPYVGHVGVDVYESLRVNISSAVKGSQLLSRIWELSVTDELTGLLNRRGFFEFAYSRLRHLRRDEYRVAVVLFMDLDGLKQINDTYGHSEGDIAITTFSKILKDTLREEDIAGRVGGDEFVVLASVRTNEDSACLKERLKENIENYNRLGNHPYNISVSIGYKILELTTKESFDAAMLVADNVLYDEKMKKKAKQEEES